MEYGWVFYKPDAKIPSRRFRTQGEAVAAASKCALAGKSGPKGKRAAHRRYYDMRADQQALVWALAQKAGFRLSFEAGS